MESDPEGSHRLLFEPALDRLSAHYIGSNGRARRPRQSVHQCPHYTSGCLLGFQGISLSTSYPLIILGGATVEPPPG